MNVSARWRTRSMILFLIGGSLLIGPLVRPTRAQSPAREIASGEDRSLQEAVEVSDQLRNDREFREALRHLSSLRQAHSGRASVLYRLAFLWSDLGKEATNQRTKVNFFKQSVAVAEAAVAADSNSAWAHLALAVAQGRLGLHVGTEERIERSRAVKEHAERAIALDSTLAAAYHVRARWHREVASLNFFQRTAVKIIYGGLPEASFEQAVDDFQRAIELENRTYHHLELGKTFARMDRSEAARRQFQQALDLVPADPFAPEYKAEARRHLENLS